MDPRPQRTEKGFVFLHRDTGKVLDFDDTFLEMLGREGEDLIGEGSGDLLKPFRPLFDPLEAPANESLVLVRVSDGTRFIGMLEDREDGFRFSLSQFPSREENLPRRELGIFYELSRDILVVGDPEKERFVQVNPAFELLLGYNEEEVLAREFFEFVHPEDRPLLQEHLMQLVKGKPVKGARMRGLTKEGNELWLEWNAFLDPVDGLFYAIGRKVHEEVRAKQKLEERGRWFHELFDSAPIAKLLHDGKVVLDLNQEALNMLGLERKSELLGEKVEEHFSVQHSKELLKRIRKLLKDGGSVHSFETTLKTPDGRLIDLEIDAGPMVRDGMNCAHLVFRDISKRKKAERELERSESEYRTIVEGIPEGIHMLVPEDPEGKSLRVEFVNEHFAKERGFLKEELIGKELHEFLKEKGAEELAEPPERALLQKEVVDYRADIEYQGELRSYSARAIPVLDENGKCVRLIVMSWNITEQERTKEKLDRLALITKETDNAIIITDADGYIEWVNDAFTDITRYHFEESKGMKPGDLLQGERSDPEEIQRMRRAIEEERSDVFELVNYTKEGTPYWIRIHIQPIFGKSGELEGFFSIQTDMTERRMMEDRIRQNEKQFRHLVENMNEGIMELDSEYNIEYVNDRYLQRLGYERNELEGQNLIQLARSLDPEVADRIASVLQERKEGVKGQNEFDVKAKNGDRVPFLISGTPIFDDEGNFKGSIVIFTDLTERKELEREVLNAVIQTQEGERKRFAEDLHDGIGQILSAVKMQLHSLEGGGEAKMHQNLSEVRNMVEQAIDETRVITHGLMPNELRDFGLVKATEKLLQELERSTAITSHLETPDQELKFTESFQVACYRILQELINNVMKHSQAENVWVRLSIDDEGKQFCFSVEDDGRGFDPARIKGGIGTTNIKRRADLFGGSIQHDSTPGEGTIVKGCLPIPSRED